MSVQTGVTLGSFLFVGGVSAGRVLPEVDIAVFSAAVSGGLFFVITSHNFNTLKKWLLLLPSVTGGIFSAKFIAQLLTSVTPDYVVAGEALGAFLSSACVVQLLVRFTSNPGAVFRTVWDALSDSITGIFRKGGGGGHG
ncbi:hypothetical protein RVW00_000158 [Enterobacter bugandensis]|nr:hypothetical protein [Enterobacter bugandensis]